MLEVSILILILKVLHMLMPGDSGITEAGSAEIVCGSIVFCSEGFFSGRSDIDSKLLKESGSDRVVFLPTAAAYQSVEHSIEIARDRWAEAGASLYSVPILARRDAEDSSYAQVLRDARLISIGDGSLPHLRSVLHRSAALDSILSAWHSGAVIVGEGAGAMALCNPMIDTRGGALTVGLGLVRGIVVLTDLGHESTEKVHRSIALAAPDHCVVGVENATMLVRDMAGQWSVYGDGHVRIFKHGQNADMDELRQVEVA